MHHQEWQEYKHASDLAFHRPKSPACKEEAELIEMSSKALSHATDPLERLRLMCLSYGAEGIMRLCRILRRLDLDDSKQLKKEVFLDGLTKSGLEISYIEAEALFNRFDPRKTGTINVDDFLEAFRPPMSEGKRAMVKEAFQNIDKNGSGAITIADLKKIYKPNSLPRYMCGEESLETVDVAEKFLAKFAAENSPDKVLTFDEFMDYYNGISVTFDNDCYSDLMMRQNYSH